MEKNKEFIASYFTALAAEGKSRKVLERFMTDEHLMEHAAFFEAAFPNYKLTSEEMTAEGDRVVVHARFAGVHQGELNGIPPTYRPVEFSFAICYQIENEKIVHHWMIVDRLALMEQLGVMNVPA